VKIWDLNNRQLAKQFSVAEHGNYVTKLALYQPNILITGALDSTIRLWDLNTNQCVTKLVYDNEVESLTVLNDGRIASGSHNNQIAIFDLNTKQRILLDNKNISLSDDNHSGVTYLAQSPDGQLIGCAFNGEVYKWHITDNNYYCEKVFKFNAANINTAALLAHNKLVIGAFNGSVHSLDLQTGKIEDCGSRHRHPIKNFFTFACGSFISCDDKGLIHYWIRGAISQNGYGFMNQPQFSVNNQPNNQI
jgi:WD40 repeat protein